MSWTDEHVESVKALWAQGLSASEIGQRLGRTRNAVIGKVYRLRLRRAFHPRAARRNRPRVSKAHFCHLRNRPALKPPERFAIQAGFQPPIEAASVTPITLAILTAHHCRWPIGDPKRPDFHYCGRTTASGHVYCPHHRAAGFRPAR